MSLVHQRIKIRRLNIKKSDAHNLAKSIVDTKRVPSDKRRVNLEDPAPQEQSAVPPKPADAPGANGKKDSTIELPMFDLEEVLTFVSGIHDKGLETAKMPDVAIGCGYKNASSTPFYRRTVAARHFGLMVSSGAELTVRARDYIKPTADDSRERVLADAVTSVPYYADQIAKLSGKRLNVELVANDIGRTFNITDSCARLCAKVFESSLRFGGFIASDGTITTSRAPKRHGGESPKDGEDEHPDSDQETQKHTLFLDRQKRRKFSIHAPLTVSKSELDRICKWLEVTMIVEDEKAELATL